MNKKIKIRIFRIIISAILLVIATFILLNSLRDNIVFFYKPAELVKINYIDKKIRLGGLVKQIISHDGNIMNFIITDNIVSIKVMYVGIVPDLFRVKQGVVAEGSFDGNIFNAKMLLTKHDENYQAKKYN